MSEAEQMSLSAATNLRGTAKPPRTLACALCQHRKTKCDRNFPCATCVKSGVQCVPVAAPRQRRRRFPERELLDRVRHLEGLLRLHSIEFEPLHASVAGEAFSNETDKDVSFRTEEHPEVKVEATYEAKNLWHAMNSKTGDSEDDNENDADIDNVKDDLRDAVGKRAWDQLYQNSTDYLLFGSRIEDFDLSLMHPSQVHIFRLWQIYSDNITPLFRVTHSPTLQARILDAAGDLTNVNPALEALMFSIYCTAVMSSSEDECRAYFGLSKGDLLKRYRFGCQQALLKGGILHTDDWDCLTALFLYMVAVRPDTDPRSLSSILGLAIRVAQRMGLDNESNYAKCTALEAEMRRRLWWSLVLFDNRVCEMSDYKAATLTPIWDCKTLLNVNDFDIRPEMSNLPAGHEEPTEATFLVLRSEVADLVRHTGTLLDFVAPSLKSIAKPNEHGVSLEALERKIEDKYLRFCNPENPVHFLTIWATRGNLARYRLFEHFARSTVQPTEMQRDAALSHALTMLECDTRLMTSPLTKRYLWFFQFHFPFPAYVHILQYLRRKPLAEHAERCWTVMSDNSRSRFANPEDDNHPFHKTPIFQAFTSIIMKAWQAREAVAGPNDKLREQPPPIIAEFQRRTMQSTADAAEETTEQADMTTTSVSDDLQMPMIMGWGGQRLMFDFNDQTPTGLNSGGYTGSLVQGTTDVDVSQMDWSTIDWNSVYVPGS